MSTAVCAGGIVAPVASGSAGAAPAPITLGSTTGTPSMNICASDCTYVPFDNVAAPSLVVPADGTVTSFAVNAGSAGSPLKLRVLRPAGGGKFTGVRTSATQTTAGGLQTFAVSLPVQRGDVLGLDNGTSALLFDTSPPRRSPAITSRRWLTAPRPPRTTTRPPAACC